MPGSRDAEAPEPSPGSVNLWQRPCVRIAVRDDRGSGDLLDSAGQLPRHALPDGTSAARPLRRGDDRSPGRGSPVAARACSPATGWRAGHAHGPAPLRAFALFPGSLRSRVPGAGSAISGHRGHDLALGHTHLGQLQVMQALHPQAERPPLPGRPLLRCHRAVESARRARTICSARCFVREP